MVNLGVVLRRADHTVALVDGDLGMANLGPMLGVTGGGTLHDVLSEGLSLEEALVEEAPGFAVLRGSESLSDYPEADPRRLEEVLDSLAADYDFVIVDTGAGLSHEDVLPLGLADRVLLVSSPDPAAVGDTRKTAELAGLARGDIAGLLVTKAESDFDAAAAAEVIGVELLGVIPYDATVRRSTAAGRPLEAVDPDTPAAEAYRELAAAIADGSAEPLQGTPTAEAMGQGTDQQADPARGAAPNTPSDAAEGSPTEPESASSDGEPAGESAKEAAEEDEVDTEEEPERTTEPDPDDEAEDPLAEFEDDDPERSGGFLAWLARIFR